MRQFGYWLAALTSVIVSATMTGCGGDDTPPPQPSIAVDVSPTQSAENSSATPSVVRDGRTPPPAVVRPGDFIIPEGRRSDILAAASEFERPLLEDGVLTFAEYERALLAGWSCLQENGVEVFHRIPWVSGGTVINDVNERLPGGRLTARGNYRYLTGSGSLSLPEFQGFLAQCAEEFYSTVEFLWIEHIAPTEQEQQEMTRRVGACMRGSGLDIPENPSDADLMKAAYPPDGIEGSQHREASGAPVASALALLDCRLVTRFDMGFE